VKSLWPRVFAAAAAAIVAALLLKVAPPIVVTAVFVAGVVAAFLYLRRSGAPERAAGLDLLGLKREAVDRFEILAHPLVLFSRAKSPSVDDVLSGPWRGLDVHVFRLSFDPPIELGEVAERRGFSCALTTIDPPRPGLVAEPQVFRTWLEDVPPEPTIRLEDTGFDGAVNVWSADAAFAMAVLPPPARAWLRGLDPERGFEIRERLVLVYGPAAGPTDVLGILEALRELLAQLPGPSSEPPSADV
jgi:hypothetical protein